MQYKGFTKIPHRLLRSQCGLQPVEKIVLLAVYSLTHGYNRNSYRIKFSELKKMTGVAGISRAVKILANKKEIELSDFKNGGSYIFTIPKQITSVNRLDHMSLSNGSTDVNGFGSTDVNGSRGAIDSSIDNIIDSSIESTLTDQLIENMKTMFPNKDIKKAKTSFINYPHHQGKNWSADEIVKRFKNWCSNEKVSSKDFLSQFRLDSTGHPIGYCAKCNVSAFYKENQLLGDSVCCSAKILPHKIIPNV